MKKKIVSILLCAAMVATMAIGCGKKEAASDEADASKDGGLIKVGIINNDPNESGYRTANDKDMKEMFTEEKLPSHTALRMMSRLHQHRNSFRTALTTFCYLQQIHLAGILC